MDFGILKVVSICSVVHLVPFILIYVLLGSNFSETSYFVKWYILVLHSVLRSILVELLGGKLPENLTSR